MVNSGDNSLSVAKRADLLATAVIAEIPPAKEPWIYFAGRPVTNMMKSHREAGPNGECRTVNGNVSVGIPNTVPLRSLGLTPPFTVK
jgi:hypothetical protein